MSTPHHGADASQPMSPDEQAALQRLVDEIQGRAERKYPQGRVSGDDLGVTAFVIAADPEHHIVRILFTKPVSWIGLDKATGEKLVALLQEKLREI